MQASPNPSLSAILSLKDLEQIFSRLWFARMPLSVFGGTEVTIPHTVRERWALQANLGNCNEVLRHGRHRANLWLYVAKHSEHFKHLQMAFCARKTCVS